MNNLDIAAMIDLRGKAVGNDDLPELMANMQPPPPDEASRFWAWVETADDPMGGLAGTVHHLKTFWDARERPNVVLLHYGAMKADLEGEMRKLAATLGIEVDEAQWPALVKAATFEEMKKKASAVGPNQTENIWLDRERFFNKGTNGQWRDVLTTEEDVKRYVARVKELCYDAFSNWAHQGAV